MLLGGIQYGYVTLAGAGRVNKMLKETGFDFPVAVWTMGFRKSSKSIGKGESLKHCVLAYSWELKLFRIAARKDLTSAPFNHLAQRINRDSTFSGTHSNCHA